jgi:dTDP-4-dehydrorhamnose reductase
MRPLVILGGEGQVGGALAAIATRRGMAKAALGRAACDVADAGEVARAVKGAALVVNCAAFTAVDRAESEAQAAYGVNAAGAEHVAAACAAASVPLVQLSTDYVFGGETHRPWQEDDPPLPLSVYGRSKLAGEVAVRAQLARHVILRTSWVFSARGHNFVRTVLRLAQTQRELRIVDDQIGGPTAAADVAEAVLTIADAALRPGFDGWGTYHFSGIPAVSWCAFARAIVEAGGRTVPVAPIATSDYPTPARRPASSVLDCRRIAAAFGIAQPDWRPALRQVMEELATGSAPSWQP